MKSFISILSGYLSKLCIICLALLGFSCSSDDDFECMYGTPIGDFEIKGKVMDEAGEPVKGATIKVSYFGVNSGMYSIATTETTDNGSYTVSGRTEDRKGAKVVCLPNNDAFSADSSEVKMQFHNKNSKDSWYFGSGKAEVDFRLKKNSGK